MKFRSFLQQDTAPKIKTKPDFLVELLAFVVLVTLAFVVVYIAANFQSLVEFRELN